MDYNFLMDAIIVGFGAYLIYCAVSMKQTGELKKGVMVRKDIDLSKAKDIQGYITYMYGKTIGIGVSTCVCGIVGLVNDTYGGLGMLYLAVIVVFLLTLVTFGYLTAKAQKKYLGI